MLLGYSFKPRRNSRALGTAGPVMPISLTINGRLHLKKTINLVRENKIDLSPEVWAAVTSTG